MVTVGLLSFIILGLVTMFSQTQRAFTTSMAQVDVMENGRALAEMVARELTEISPAYLPRTVNLYVDYPSEPFLQGLPESNRNRTNVLQRMFFLTRHGSQWSASGYYVVPDFPGAGVGTLYRYQSNNVARTRLPLLLNTFLTRPATNSVAKGIVDFKITPIAANGFPIVKVLGYTNAFFSTNVVNAAFPFRPIPNTATEWAVDASMPDLFKMAYYSNALPAFLDLEIAVLEPKTLERLNSYSSINQEAHRAFLSNHVAQVHVFRQRIPVRNVDFSVYQ